MSLSRKVLEARRRNETRAKEAPNNAPGAKLPQESNMSWNNATHQKAVDATEKARAVLETTKRTGVKLRRANKNDYEPPEITGGR